MAQTTKKVTTWDELQKTIKNASYLFSEQKERLLKELSNVEDLFGPLLSEEDMLRMVGEVFYRLLNVSSFSSSEEAEIKRIVKETLK